MSFPNPDNYARDCDCGTAGANTTPPPAQLIAEAEAVILTNPLILPLGGTINTSRGNSGGTGGSINTSGADEYNGGSINTNAFAGYNGGGINTSGGSSGGGGSINTSNGGGYIDTRGSTEGWSGGNINTSGGADANGGSINLSNNGGSILSTGDADGAGGTLNMSYAVVDGDAFPGGNINTSGGGSINLSQNGGSINLSGDGGGTAGGSITSIALNGYEGGSINLNAGSTVVGGSIDTSNGGGSINTTGVGSIQLGVSATRTTLNGNGTAARTVTLPNITGTLPIALISASTALNFPNIISNNFQDLTITLTGAATSDVVFVTCISGGRTAPDDTKLLFEAFVSASNTVTVRAHNKTPGDINPASYNFKVAIIKTA